MIIVYDETEEKARKVEIVKQYVVDAFTDTVFKGNPAAVCVLDGWLPENVMMDITRENNLSETAFAVKENDSYHLCWFTPGGEIDLCGHAALAAAYILLRFYEPGAEKISFQTKSGKLTVNCVDGLLEMDFPMYSLTQVEVTEEMTEAVGVRPVEAWMGRDLVCVLENEEQVCRAEPDQSKAARLDGLLLHVTARGKDYDCVSRSFAPKLDVAEDPVCGSGHCHIIPLWADKLKKESFIARQESKRGGTLYCRIYGDRMKIAGHGALYSEAELFI